MDILNTVLPILLYILCAALLVVLIILGIKLIGVVDRANKILNEMEEKARSLDGLFSAIDGFSGIITNVGDKVVDSFSGVIGKIFSFTRNRKEREEDDYE